MATTDRRTDSRTVATTGDLLAARAGLLIIRTVFGLLGRMEYTRALGLARRLVSIYGVVSNQARLRRISAFFGPLGWNADRCAALNKAHLRYLARWTVEIGRLVHQPPEEIAQRVKVVGEEHLQAALARNQGVLLLISHLGTNLHIGCAVGLRGYPLCGVFNARTGAGRKYFNRLAARHHFEFAFVGKGAALAVRRTLRRNGIFGLALDGDARRGCATPIRFGHMALPIDTGPATLALRLRCAVVLATSRQMEDGRSLVTFLPDPTTELWSQASPSPEALCERWLKVFHDELLAVPDQWWLWSFANFSELSQARATQPE